MTQRFARWRELLAERVHEAVAELGAVSGVRGLILGGSVGRGEPWPMSDIDILPITDGAADTNDQVTHCQSRMVDWWAASGRAQTLDVSWLRFVDADVERAIGSEASFAAERMKDRLWFHGMDKSYGGRGAADPDGLAESFTRWATAMRFEPRVLAARVEEWKSQVEDARRAAHEALRSGDAAEATLRLRDSARFLRMVLLEGWSERLGSMGREWTLWERVARERGAADLAERIAVLAFASPKDALERSRVVPLWLRERIELAWAARLEIGEEVTEAESARDQIAAFAVHVPRHRPKPWGDWLGLPDPELAEKLAELDTLAERICG